MATEKKDKKLAADIYNISKVIVWIACIGIPLKLWYVAFTSGMIMDRILVPVIASLISAAILTVLELLVFRKWSKKLDTKPAITQGNMYVRTTESYRSAFDDRGRIEPVDDDSDDSHNKSD